MEFSNNGFSVKIEYDQQQNIEANTSTITVTDIQVKASSWQGVVYYLRGAVIVGDKRISLDNKDVYIQKKGEYASVNATFPSVTVKHLNDGTLSVAISVEISGYTTSGGGGSGWKVTGTENVTLETIPRASTISLAADTVLGTPCRVQWTPLSASFGYKLKFFAGKNEETTELIQPNTTGLYTYTGYTFPRGVAAIFPNDTKGTMNVALYTYSADGEQIGEADTKEFTVTLIEDEKSKPKISIDALTPVTALASPFDTIFLQGKSKVKVDYTGEGKFGATVESYSVSVNGKPSADISDYLSEYGTVTIKVTAVDTRGFSNTASKTIEVLPYAVPKIVPLDDQDEVICARWDGTSFNGAGEQIMVVAKSVISDVGGKNSSRMWLKWKLASESDAAYSNEIKLTDNSSTYQDTVKDVSFRNDTSYIVQIGVTDAIGESADMTFTILSEEVYWHRGNRFLSLGMRRSSGGFEVAWDTRFYGDVYVGEFSLEDYIKKIIQGG